MIIDLFAGIGWGIGIRALGLDEIGIDVDPDVCANRVRHGLTTIRADVSTFPLEPLTGRLRGLLASPPCTDWSAAGRRAGRDGETGWLIDEPLRWTLTTRPRWAAWEQVPEALPVWQDAARALRHAGYSVWCGVLDAARYGVPQHRRRAILMASLDGPVQPPEPTHGDPSPSLFGPSPRPLVAWGAALHLEGVIDRRQMQGPKHAREPVPSVPHTRPAPTVTASAAANGVWILNGRQLTAGELGTLQGFPPGLELNRRVIGDAVPPPLARAIVEQLDGHLF